MSFQELISEANTDKDLLAAFLGNTRWLNNDDPSAEIRVGTHEEEPCLLLRDGEDLKFLKAYLWDGKKHILVGYFNEDLHRRHGTDDDINEMFDVYCWFAHRK